MQKHDIASLNSLYQEADAVDKDLFSEMRSNLLLVSGNHYSKTTQNFFAKIRASKTLEQETKLRITKNHIHRVTRTYSNQILSRVPGVTVVAQNELENRDRKAAELNLAVIKDGKTRYRLDDKRRVWAHHFIELGEVCNFLYYDPNIGQLTGYEAQVDENGTPVLDETGNYIADETKPIFSGGFQFKTIPGYNLLRAPSAKEMRESPYHIIREMVDKKELLAIYQNDQEKVKFIEEGGDSEFVVFDSNKLSYSKEEKQVLLRYHFFKPCILYPKGYFYISTEAGILDQGELPFGIYPIDWGGFETYTGTPRGYSIIKVARPYQAEINRASSQMAMHQITVGDDKIIYQAGTKLSQGALLPGVRGITYQGMAPQILAGRDGSQFVGYITGQISEMYQACLLDEVIQEKPDNQADPYVLIFKSASQQVRLAEYIQKFEQFLIDVHTTFLNMAKYYYPDDMVIQAIGRSEAINMAEFRATEPLSYMIKVEASTDTFDTKMGKQIALNHILQYAGSQLDQKYIGLIIKEMPFLNNTKMFKSFTVDFENVENDILALDRGQIPRISPYSENQVYVDMTVNRMKQADFNLLSPVIQQNYEQYLQQHYAEMQRKEEAKRASEQDSIPTGGALITCSMQLPDEKDPTKSKQVRLPHESIMWLIKTLNAQGQSQENLAAANEGVVADAMNRILAGSAQASGPAPSPAQFM